MTVIDEFTDKLTVADARDDLMNNLEEGRICPCCNQFAKEYRWSLYGTAVQALFMFYRLGGTDEFVHSSRLKDLGHRGQGDAARLRVWGLVERDETPRDDGGRSGFWRVTKRGERFLLGGLRVPKYAFIYNGELRGMDKTRWVDVHQALGKKFNYNELFTLISKETE